MWTGSTIKHIRRETGVRCVLVLLAWSLWQGSMILPTIAGPIDLTPAALQKLRNGETLIHVSRAEGTNAGGRVMAIIDVPTSPRRLWAIMLDCTKATKLVSGLKSCRVIEAGPQGTWDIREHIIQWIWVFPKMRSVFHSEYISNRRIQFRKIEGDFKELKGEWRLEPLNRGRKTRLYYQVVVDVGSVIPGAIIRAAIKHDLSKTLKAIRHEAVFSSASR